MSEMVERVAKVLNPMAFSEILIIDTSGGPSRMEPPSPSLMESARFLARRVLAAMREPTEEMADAGRDEIPEHSGSDDDGYMCSPRTCAIECWQTMIAEALK